VGIWRRIKTIPFERVFTADEVDKTIDKRIEAEYPGILAWAVEGFKLWQKEGLGKEQKVEAATAEYKEDSDIIGAFLEENCVEGAALRIKSTDITKTLQEWAKDNGMRHISRSELIEYMKKKGYSKDRGDRGYTYWYGLGMRSHREEPRDERTY